MKTDLVLSSFNADMKTMLNAAQIADTEGFNGVWTYDHFSATMVQKAWSLHPFTALGALAATTGRVQIGCLVANSANRHPSQLASAVGTLVSLAPGRVLCGIGAGAGPGSSFSSEQSMIGRELELAPTRRRQLIEVIESIRAIWSGTNYDGEFVPLVGPSGMVPPVPLPPIIVGATSVATAVLAAEHADGVNLLDGPGLSAQIRAVREATTDRAFDLSVHGEIDLDHPIGGPVDRFIELGFSRRTLAIRAPYDLAKLEAIASRLGDP